MTEKRSYNESDEISPEQRLNELQNLVQHHLEKLPSVDFDTDLPDKLKSELDQINLDTRYNIHKEFIAEGIEQLRAGLIKKSQTLH